VCEGVKCCELNVTYSNRNLQDSSRATCQSTSEGEGREGGAGRGAREGKEREARGRVWEGYGQEEREKGR
jgi:hypothetical protein